MLGVLRRSGLATTHGDDQGQGQPAEGLTRVLARQYDQAGPIMFEKGADAMSNSVKPRSRRQVNPPVIEQASPPAIEQIRKPAIEQIRPPVKTSVPLPFNVHVRLAALAALRGQTLGELAAEFIAAGVDASGVKVSLGESD